VSPSDWTARGIEIVLVGDRRRADARTDRGVELARLPFDGFGVTHAVDVPDGEVWRVVRFAVEDGEGAVLRRGTVGRTVTSDDEVNLVVPEDPAAPNPYA
jgi:hypothetical protein